MGFCMVHLRDEYHSLRFPAVLALRTAKGVACVRPLYADPYPCAMPSVHHFTADSVAEGGGMLSARRDSDGARLLAAIAADE